MRTLLHSCLLYACLAGPALGQSPDEITAERTRITSERARAEAEFSATEKACYGRFAVTGCIDDARKRKNETLSDLRRQEVGLNDLERKRRAAERAQELEQRRAQQEARQEQGRARGPAEQADREDRATKKARQAEPKPGTAGPREGKAPQVPDVEDNLRRDAERQLEAQERRKKVEERAARKRKQAAPLPVPAN